MRTCSGSMACGVSDLPPINPFELKKDIQQLLNFINATPSINWDDKQLY